MLLNDVSEARMLPPNQVLRMRSCGAKILTFVSRGASFRTSLRARINETSHAVRKDWTERMRSLIDQALDAANANSEKKWKNETKRTRAIDRQSP